MQKGSVVDWNNNKRKRRLTNENQSSFFWRSVINSCVVRNHKLTFMTLRNFMFLVSVMLIGCEPSVKISESPEVIRAIYDTGYSACYFSFKQDSTFEWFSGSALGASDLYQGKYLINDSAIILDKVGFDQAIKSTKLLITTTHPMPRGVEGNYIIQVDKFNKFLDSTLFFTVIVDKRLSK
jgi:hypothetical protein